MAQKGKVDVEKIKIYMARECMSRQDVAEKAKIPLATFANVLCKESCTTKTIGKISKALKVDVLEIIKTGN